MKYTDYILERSVWFSAKGGRGYLAHIVARDLIERATIGDREGYNKLLNIVRRYE